MESEHGYNSTIKEEIPKESEIEIKEEFAKDPFAILETFSNTKDIRDIVKEDKMESNVSFPIEIEDFACKTELKPSQHGIQEINIEPEPCYNNTIMEDIPNENDIEIKEEFPKDPFALLETSNNCKDISIMVYAEKTSNFKCKSCNEDFSTKNKLSWHISQVHNSYPPIKEEILEESENEIKEEFPKDPFASLETFNNSEGASDTEYENHNSNDENKGYEAAYKNNSLLVSTSLKLLNGTKFILNDKIVDLTSKTSSNQNAKVSSKTTNYTKKCTYCWIEVKWRGHFQHEKACAKEFAKKSSRKLYAGHSKVSTKISDKKKERKCEHCDEMKHARSLKAHAEKCQKFRKLVKNGMDCGICSRSFVSKGTTALYMHLSHSHKNELVEKNETMEPNESMDKNDTLEQSKENITEEKVKKAQCGTCNDMIHIAAIKKHTRSCQNYQKLIRNGSECIVCSKNFESRKLLYSHIGKIHKHKVLELKKVSEENQRESMEQNVSIEQN